MDSVTQLALGAAVGQAALGRTVGRRALAWGAALGTLPDLDVFVPWSDPVAAFTEHRGISHSVFVLAALVPLCAALAVRIHPDTRTARRGWQRLAALVLGTHVLLDCFTVYGTQIFWPLPWAPESWSTVFVVDPAYTAPLVFGVLGAALWAQRRPPLARRANALGLWLSTAYLAWTCVAKAQVERVVRADLASRGIACDSVLTTPTPLNSVLWRIVAMDGDRWLEGYHSLLADGDAIRWTEHDAGSAVAPRVFESDPRAERLRWFAHGFCDVTVDAGELVVRDLRMGAAERFVFRFVLGRVEGDAFEATAARKLESEFSSDDLATTWERIFRPDPPR